MIREEKFVLSRRPFAVALNSLQVTESEAANHWCRLSAVWFRREKGVTKACTGYIRNIIRGEAPSTGLEALECFKHDPWGGHCEGRWDGERYWGAQEPGVIHSHLALLVPMLECYPAIPGGYDGWWRY